jgi:CheY-like chemotaxis protein
MTGPSQSRWRINREHHQVKAKILIIDDDAIVRNTICQILEDDGYEVVSAPDGQRGLTLFASARPDLVITDIIMPEKEGISTITAIRASDRNIPIIAISGGGRIGNADFLEIARRAGANRTVPKPFDQESIVACIEDCLDHYRTQGSET